MTRKIIIIIFIEKKYLKNCVINYTLILNLTLPKSRTVKLVRKEKILKKIKIITTFVDTLN